MDVEKAPLEEADFIVRQQRGRVSGLEAELEDLLARKAKIEADLDNARRCAERRGSYVPVQGHQHFCPQCWIIDGRKCELRGVPSSTDDDIENCRSCGREYPIPSRT
jgi:RNase P subunit RPR2